MADQWTDMTWRLFRCLVAIGAAVLLGFWYAGFVGVGNPSPADIAAKCRAHERVERIVPRPWPGQRVRVICRDGAVFDVP